MILFKSEEHERNYRQTCRLFGIVPEDERESASLIGRTPDASDEVAKLLATMDDPNPNLLEQDRIVRRLLDT